MSIHPILQKIKALTEKDEFQTILMILIIILVGLAGFGLGKLSVSKEDKSIIIQNQDKQDEMPLSNKNVDNIAGAVTSSILKSNIGIVASKNGTRYYLPGCSGVGRIQDQNKVYFNSEKEALDAGYSKASGCK